MFHYILISVVRTQAPPVPVTPWLLYTYFSIETGHTQEKIHEGHGLHPFQQKSAVPFKEKEHGLHPSQLKLAAPQEEKGHMKAMGQCFYFSMQRVYLPWAGQGHGPILCCLL